MMKKTYLFLVLFSPLFAWSQVVINEVSCSNFNSLSDNYGNFEDWIELYNTSPFDLDLQGWYLSDDPGNPQKWAFPSMVIPGNGRKTVWASGRNLVAGTNVHTNFKLTQTQNETLCLANTAGTVVDSKLLVPTRMGHSFGRVTDGSPLWGIFPAPSPGNPNAGAKAGYVSKPFVSLPGGAYATSITLDVSSPNPASVVRFTLDGTEPVATSPMLSGSLTLTTTKVLKAMAFSTHPDSLDSYVEFHTYLISENHTVQVISITGNQISQLLAGNSGLHPIGSFEIFNADGTLMDKAYGDFNKHGNDSWAYQQRGFDYIARDAFGYNHAIHGAIFPSVSRTEFQRLIVKAAANDNYPFQNGGAEVRDSYVHSLAQMGNMNIDCRSHKPCVVYVNGAYWGVYDIREKVDDHDFTKYYYDQSEFDIDFIKTWGSTWAEYGSNVDWLPLKAFILGNDMSVQANYDYVTSQFDVLSLIDYLIINTQSVCKDWLNWNTAWWHGRNPEGGATKWRYALWDMDATFGHYINYTGIPDISSMANPCDPLSLGGSSDPQGHMQLVNKLMENTQFHDLYVNRYADLNNTIFTCEFMIQHLDSLVGLIAPEMPRHIAKWGGTVSTWENNVQAIRNFINERCNYIIKGIGDCFGVNGGCSLTLEVDPPGAGYIGLNTITLHEFPWTGSYFSNVTASIEAFAVDSFIFDHWEFLSSLPLPNDSAAAVSFFLNNPDSIVAHFRLPETPDTNHTGGWIDQQGALRVWPALTSDEVQIRGQAGKSYDARLLSLTGQPLGHFQVSDRGRISLKSLGLPPGAYLLVLRDAVRLYPFKILLR